jgi:hypothetical protein
MAQDMEELAGKNAGLTRKLIVIEGVAEAAEQTNHHLKKNLAQSE